MRLNLPKDAPGKAWTIRVVRKPPRLNGEDCWGLCDTAKREIKIWKKSADHGMARDTALHEMLHKFMPWMEEAAVAHMASEMDYALDALESAGILET